MNRFTREGQALIDVWETHTASEFVNKDADAAIATMTDRPVLIHVPVNTGAAGREALRKFYAEILIPQMPEDATDATLDLLTRSVGQGHLVEEFILRLTIPCAWTGLLPASIPESKRSPSRKQTSARGYNRN